jgi:acetylornithine deacetylase/succinyl-diaminopimelate desuccinylase-like protein
VHYCSQQRGYPAKPLRREFLTEYTVADIRREFQHDRKILRAALHGGLRAPGFVHRFLARAADRLRLDIFVGGAIPTKANLVVRFHGSGRRKPILLLAHTDVVEAKREDWSMDPFQFIERDGYFYGRGTADDKAQAAVWIANLIRYKREGFKPDRDIVVALTADEEGGGPYNGVEWLIKNRRDLIDAEYALNEGGWGEMAGGKKISNDIQVSEKYVINFRLEVRNKGGHSSLPVADNAIYHLAAALDRLSKFNFPLKTNEVTRAYFEAMSKIETGPVKDDLAAAAAGSRSDAEGRASIHRLECDAAHHLRGDADRGRARQKRAAPTGGGQCELPGALRGLRRIRPGHSAAGNRGRPGEPHDRRRSQQGSGVADAGGRSQSCQPSDRHIVARRAHGPDYGHEPNHLPTHHPPRYAVSPTPAR